MEGDAKLPISVVRKTSLKSAELLGDKNLTPISSQEKQTALHHAAQVGDEKLVRILLEKGVSCSPRDNDGFTPLLIACERGFLDVVRLLLNPHIPGFKDQPLPVALIRALSLGHEEIVLALLDAGASPNTVLEPDLTLPSRSSHRHTEFGLSPLFLACEEGHLRIVTHLLKRGAQINWRRPIDNYSALHIACQKGHTEIVSVLLNNGALVNVKGNNGITPLHLAAVKGFLKIVELLIAKSADVNAQASKGSTAVLLAVEKEHEGIVKLLLDNGADIGAKNENNDSPLSLAIEMQNLPLVSLLLQYSPTFDDKISELVTRMITTDFLKTSRKIVNALCECGFTPRKEDAKNGKILWAAVNKGHYKIVKQLLNFGADCRHKEFDSTLLHIAVENGYIEIIKLLLNFGCVVNAEDGLGNTPVFYSMRCRDKNNWPIIIQLLLDKGANLKKAPILLHEAVFKESLKTCELLVENGADINAIVEGYSPLQLIVSDCDRFFYFFRKQRDPKDIDDSEKIQILNFLVGKGADFNVTTNRGLAVLHLAALKGCHEAVETLLNHGDNVNSCTNDNSVPLHFAAEKGHVSVLEALLRKKADVNARRDNGDTPLHCAAFKGHVRAVEILLEFNADVNAVALGGTALHYAVLKNWNEVATVLLNNGIDVNISNRDGRTAFDLADIPCSPSSLGIENPMLPRKSDCHVDRNLMIGQALVRQVIKLTVAKLNMCDKIYQKFPVDSGWLLQFKSDCEEELRKMKLEFIGRNLNLHDILMTNQRNPQFVKNELLVQSIEALSQEKFPIYYHLIMNGLKKNRMRAALVSQAGIYLGMILKTSNVFCIRKSPALPAELLVEIASHLSDKDLKCLIACGEEMKKQFRK
ncbi:unnamed protein product [Bemisia tabaci]|uniref:Uncharacterized protein n=1 Tax=Bemisia tabaci TaxID=7038 RepID=A0A9P0ACZ5_BEMTA|nr:unnamed protein product [Bemisia tabaci]